MNTAAREQRADESRLRDTLTRWMDEGIESLHESDIDYLKSQLVFEVWDRAERTPKTIPQRPF